MLALVIGAVLTMLDVQGTALNVMAESSVGPMSTTFVPSIPRQYPVAGASLNVWYTDDYRRIPRPALPLNDTRIMQDGILHHNWTVDSHDNEAAGNLRYVDTRPGVDAEFCSVVGVRATWLLDMTGGGGNTLVEVNNLWAQVEFASPDNPNNFSAYPPGMNIISRWEANDYGRQVLRFMLTYTEIGVYRITFRSLVQGTARENIYYVTVRGWILDVDYHIHLNWTRGGQSHSAGLQIVNTGSGVMFEVSPFINTRYLGGLMAERKGPDSRISVMFIVPHGGALVEMNIAGMHDGDCILEDYFYLQQMASDRLRFTSMEYVEFQNVQYMFHTTIRAIVPTVGADMRWIAPVYNDQSERVEYLRIIDVHRFGTVAFTAPAGRGPGFPWLMFVILLSVLLILGLTIPGLNILIRKTQDAHVRRRNQERTEKEELDEQNIELLRRQINIENENIKEYEFINEAAEELLKQLREEGGDL